MLCNLSCINTFRTIHWFDVLNAVVYKLLSLKHVHIPLTEELQEAERRREEGDSSAPTVRAQIPFTACMAALSEPEILTDFWSSAVQTKTTATKYEERHPCIFSD